MASWGATARVEAPGAAPRVRPRSATRRHHRPVNPLRSGVVWIVVVGALFAGLVALNVAVLQLNVRLDKLGGTSWEKVKRKTRESIFAMAKELLGIYAAREIMDRKSVV